MKPKLSERLDAVIVTTHVPVWRTGGEVQTFYSDSRLTGAELVERIAGAKVIRDRLNKSIAAMEDTLDNGETVADRELRIEMETRYPEATSRSHGWYSIEDFAAICDKTPTGFYKRISSCRGHIVKPRPRMLEKLLGNGWNEYPERCEHWGDHFDFAENWEEALKRVRAEQIRALAEKYS